MTNILTYDLMNGLNLQDVLRHTQFSNLHMVYLG